MSECLDCGCKMSGMDKMVTQRLGISIADSIGDSPVYKNWNNIRMVKAIIVRNGTKEGRSTVDLQCVDSNGNKHLIMVTGAIINSLSKFIGNE